MKTVKKINQNQIINTNKVQLFDQSFVKKNEKKWKDFVINKLVDNGFKKKWIENHINYKNIRFKPEVIAANLGFINELFKKRKPGSSDNTIPNRRDNFISNYGPYLKKVSRRYKVPQEVISSILWVETRMGSYTGSFSVMNVYYNLTLLEEPEVYYEMLNWLQEEYPDKDLYELSEKMIKRAKWGFYQLRSVFKLKGKIAQPLNHLKGSYAGAFGIPQFIPSSYLYYAKDGNSDGLVDLFNMKDAIRSVAHYLSKMGWKNHVKKNQQSAILAYNRSSAYLNKVMSESEFLKSKIHPADLYPDEILSPNRKVFKNKKKKTIVETQDHKEILQQDVNKVLMNMNNRM